jgi:hypothetical protein
MKYESTLTNITEQVYKAASLNEAKTAMVDYLKTTRVKEADKMIQTATKINNLLKLQEYFTNCLLRFEGLSVNSYQKEVASDQE